MNIGKAAIARQMRRLMCLSFIASGGVPMIANAELLGVNPQIPLINFSGTGTTRFTADSGLFEVRSTPIALVRPPVSFIGPNLSSELAEKSFDISVRVSASGELLGGVSGDDLIIVGSVDSNGDSFPDANGVLLTGEVLGFGHRDTGTVTDLYDFVFRLTGGELAHLYAGYDLAVTMNSETSSFSGSFAVDFTGKAKGTLGIITSQPEPAIEICTLVTLAPDSISNFADADLITGDSCDVYSQPIPVGVAGEVDGTYKLKVTNNGTESLVDVVINAPEFGIVNEPIPSVCGILAPNESCVIGMDDTGFSALEVKSICELPGTVSKIASTTGQGQASGIHVSDDDPAIVECVTEPHISFRKEVSLNGGAFFDANTVATAPSGKVGSNAEYRFTVTNDGTEALSNVVINDAALGLVNVAIGVNPLQPGATVVLTQNDSGFSALNATGRCDSIGVHLNSAAVNAEGELSSIPVASEDPAYISCENPQIELLKKVSITGSEPFYNADLSTDPDVPVGLVGQTDATYRFIVKNKGTELLTQVVLEDSKLGIFQTIEDLLPGERRIITAEAPFGHLFQPDVCAGETGNQLNIASVSAIGALTGASVSDDNPANVKCIQGPAIKLEKQVRFGGATEFQDADTAATGPTALLSDDEFHRTAIYRLVVKNIGDEDLTNVTINDLELNINNVVIANLPVGATVILNKSNPGFENLYAVGQCEAAGSKLNIAKVNANGSITGTSVEDENPAYINCEAPIECAVAVDQTCVVTPKAGDDMLCTDSISATTLRYTGPNRAGATVSFSGKDGGAVTYSGVDLESNVTILTKPNQNGYTLDAGIGGKLGSKTTITVNGMQEIIHTSCSAIYSAGQPAPLDSNTPNPPNSSKGDPSPNWSVVNFRQKDDVVIAAPVGGGEGADSCSLPFGGGEVTYAYQVNNTGAVNVEVTSVVDSELGEMLVLAPTLLAAGDSLALKSSPIYINQSTTNSVNVSANVVGNQQATCPAIDTVDVAVAPPPILSCADGKPATLVFEYTGEKCEARPANTQEGKFSCSGSPNKSKMVQLVVAGASTDPVDESIAIGDYVTVSPTGDKFDSQTDFQIMQGGRVVQDLSMHLSCSKPINVGDRFGSLTLRVFIPGNSSGGMGGMGGMGSMGGMGGMGDEGMGGMGGMGM